LNRQPYLRMAVLAASLFLSLEVTTSVTASPKTNYATVEKTTVTEPYAYYVPKGKVLYTNSSLSKAKVTTSKYSKTTWYSKKTAIIIKTSGNTQKKAHYAQITSANGKHSYWTWNGNLKPITSAGFKIADKAAGSRFKKIKLAYMGDSIPHGWSGAVNYINSNYPTWMAKYLGISMTASQVPTNMAISSGKILGSQNRDMPQIMHRQDFKKYNMMTIQYGTNDYAHSEYSLKEVMTELQKNITTIKSSNPKLKIYGILPLSRFQKGSGEPADHIKMSGGYTFNQLKAAERKLYKKNHIAVIDFQKLDPNLITAANRKTTLRDHVLHPAAKTDQYLGHDAARFIEKNYK